jgi:predicted HTH transcriptional regulator
MLEEGENFRVEFKQRFSSHEKIAKEIIAFANSKGGSILFGIDDDASIYGVLSEKEVAELVKECAEKYCEPPVKYNLHFFEIENKEIVIAEIFESENKPHRLQDYLPQIDINNSNVYLRVNDKSVLAAKEMIKIMQAKSNGLKLQNYEVGKNEKLVFDYLDGNETITVKELSKLANLSSRRASRTLIKLVRAGLLNIHTKDNGENYFTYAG